MWIELPRCLLDTSRQLRYLVENRTSLGNQLRDLPVRVHHGGVITPPEDDLEEQSFRYLLQPNLLLR